MVPEDMSIITYPTVPEPPRNCRLVRIVYKGIKYSGISIDPEVIEINGQIYNVSVLTTSAFRYDQRGRLLEELRRHWRNYTDTLTYAHDEKRVVIYSSLVHGGERYRTTDTLRLNERGLAENKPGDYLTASFDNDGFLLRGERVQNGEYVRLITQTIVNQNITSIVDYLRGSFGTMTKRYPQYIARPNLPNSTPFYGSTSRNLPDEEIISNKGSIYYSDGPKYRTRYLYQFDQLGRVKRRIAYGVTLNTDWPFVFDEQGIGITDYEYECI